MFCLDMKNIACIKIFDFYLHDLLVSSASANLTCVRQRIIVLLLNVLRGMPNFVILFQRMGPSRISFKIYHK